MKKISIPLFFLLAMQFVSAQQPTKAVLDKMMKQAQDQMKKISKDTSLSKLMKNMQDQQKQVNDAMKSTGSEFQFFRSTPDDRQIKLLL